MFLPHNKTSTQTSTLIFGLHSILKNYISMKRFFTPMKTKISCYILKISTFRNNTILIKFCEGRKMIFYLLRHLHKRLCCFPGIVYSCCLVDHLTFDRSDGHLNIQKTLLLKWLKVCFYEIE